MHSRAQRTMRSQLRIWRVFTTVTLRLTQVNLWMLEQTIRAPLDNQVRPSAAARKDWSAAQVGYGSSGSSKKINGFPVAESLIPSITILASFQIAV